MSRRIDPKYITHKHIAEILAKTEGIRKDVALVTVEEIFGFMRDKIAEHHNIWISGLGSFWISEYKKEKIKNVRDGNYFWWHKRPTIRFMCSRKINKALTKNMKGKDE